MIRDESRRPSRRFVFLLRTERGHLRIHRWIWTWPRGENRD